MRILKRAVKLGFNLPASIAQWILGSICAWVLGFIIGLVLDYLTHAEQIAFAEWFRSAPFDAVAPNFLGVMAVLLYAAIRLIFGG